MSMQEMVDNPMWFAEQSEINDDFVRGYNQAVYQIRLKLSSMDKEPEEIREYTEFMIRELCKRDHKAEHDDFSNNDMLKHILIIKTRGNFLWRLWFLISAPIIWLLKGTIKIK